VLIGLVFAFLGGWGGLASCLAYLNITDALNRYRSADDQIPQIIVSWVHLQRHSEFISKNGPFYSFKLVRDFRNQFPNAQAYWWYVGGCIWAFSFFLIAAFMFLGAR
jgi:hypothetical protein